MDAQEDDVESLDLSYALMLGVICVRGKDCGAQDAWTVVVCVNQSDSVCEVKVST